MKKNARPLVELLECRNLLSADLGALFARDFLDASSYAIDGSGNNPAQPDWGATDTQLVRLVSVDYADGLSAPAGADRPSARAISNAVAAQSESTPNDRYLTDFAWLWGQFIDHDLDLTEGADPAESFPIEVPAGDPWFDPFGTGTQTISLNRSNYDPETGDDDPRQQINQITAWLDGSMIYGSDPERAAALRTGEGGKLKTSAGDLLPFNTDGLENAGGTSSAFFLAGDVRANENALLTSMHTLWVREHNYWADRIAAENPDLDDEAIYQRARSLVIAELQVITYSEWLPALLGTGALGAYTGYDPTVNPGISNIFSTASFRVGHSLLSPELQRLNEDGTTAAEGNLALRDAFFASGEVADHGIDSLLRGAASQLAQEIDTRIVDDVRNFLFGPPGAGGFDLASLNIQRGRDHGLPSYNQARIDLGLTPAATFADITSDPQLQALLEQVYQGDVDAVDVWVGGLAEDHLPGSSVGELIQTVLIDQFDRIRDGDPNWYENVYSGATLAELKRTTLADVLRRNTAIEDVQDNVFLDRSVLQITPIPRQGPIEIVVDRDAVRVLAVASHRVLATRPLDEVEQIQVIGTDRPDQVRIRVAPNSPGIPGGILVFGGPGRGDILTMVGSPGRDTLVVDGQEMVLNGTTIRMEGVEDLRLAMDRGDSVTVVGGVSPPGRHGQHPQRDQLQVLPFGPGGNEAQPGPVGHLAAAEGIRRTLAQQIIDQVRNDLLRQARQVLPPDRYEEFAEGLTRRQEVPPPPPSTPTNLGTDLTPPPNAPRRGR